VGSGKWEVGSKKLKAKAKTKTAVSHSPSAKDKEQSSGVAVATRRRGDTVFNTNQMILGDNLGQLF
jgi:3-deoxy-D-manno-octulosonic-acid transferase